MKKTIMVAIGITAVLSACSTQAVSTTTTTEYVPPTTAYVSPDENYLDGLTYDYPSEVALLGKATALKMGRLTCQAIDEGSTLTDFAQLAIDNDVDPGFIGAMIRESVENFCPENQWFIDSVMNA